MKTAAAIIDELGGSAAIARDKGWALTTIESWKGANFIPEWRRDALIALAGGKKLPLAESDFPTIEQRRARSSRPTDPQAAKAAA